MKDIDSLTQIKELIQREESFYIYFSAINCGVCQSVKPKIKHLFESIFPNIKAFTVDTSIHEHINAQNNIYSNPSIIVYIKGTEVIRQSRILNLADISEKVKRLYKFV